MNEKTLVTKLEMGDTIEFNGTLYLVVSWVRRKGNAVCIHTHPENVIVMHKSHTVNLYKKEK